MSILFDHDGMRCIEGSYWCYLPNKGAPIAFAVLFLISGIIHVWQNRRYHSWKMTFYLPWASLEFVVAYILRELGAFYPSKIGYLIAVNILVLTAAPVYTAALYFILGRTLGYLPYLSPIHPGRVVTTFLGLDFIISILIGIGAGRSFSARAASRGTYINLIKAAMIMQVLCFIGLVAVALVFHRRAIKANLLTAPIRTVLLTLYASSFLIFARSIFRLVEFFEGPNGKASTVELYFWVFESAVMLVNSFLLNAFHPGRFLPRNSKIYLDRDGVTEGEGLGFVDERWYLWTWLDPFDIVGLVQGRDTKTAFWETKAAEDRESKSLETRA